MSSKARGRWEAAFAALFAVGLLAGGGFAAFASGISQGESLLDVLAFFGMAAAPFWLPAALVLGRLWLS